MELSNETLKTQLKTEKAGQNGKKEKKPTV